MRMISAVLLASVLAACATSTKIVGPNGTPAYTIACGAAMIGSCYEKAGEICPAGYITLNSSDAKYLGNIGTFSANPAFGSGTSTPMITRNSMLIECKPAA